MNFLVIRYFPRAKQWLAYGRPYSNINEAYFKWKISIQDNKFRLVEDNEQWKQLPPP